MMFWQNILQNIPQMVKKAFFGAPVDISELLLQAGNAINSKCALLQFLLTLWREMD